MIAQAFVRQFAAGQKIDLDVADQEVVRLVPRSLASDPEQICERVRARFGFLTELDQAERSLLDDQVAHREHRLFAQRREQARELAAEIRR